MRESSARGARGRRVMLIDVKKAFLYGQINRTVFVELPAEDPMSKTGLCVGQLEKLCMELEMRRQFGRMSWRRL